ncbi:radical SAM protein [bacterium]|nr:radical SAM protein [bacterium]
MPIHETLAKSILIKYKKVDSWFLSGYGMNLYRGCTHNCAYCDGRAEKYRVEGEFGHDVVVKTNAPELLEKALNPGRKRKPMKRAFILVGGGVGDTYQPSEKHYQLASPILRIIQQFHYPVHLLTKSTLVERDLPLLVEMNRTQRVLVSMSFSSTDDNVSAVFEPGCDPPTKRLSVLAKMKKAGLATGMFLLPVIPGVTDTEKEMSESLAQAREVGVGFVLFGGMTLKAGAQQDHFRDVLGKKYPGLQTLYDKIYTGDIWGNAQPDYAMEIQRRFNRLAGKYKLARRMPPAIYTKFLSDNDRVMVMLEHLDYLLKSEGKKSPYGYAAYSISKLEGSIKEKKNSLRTLSGVGPVTEKIINEILDTGTCRYLTGML